MSTTAPGSTRPAPSASPVSETSGNAPAPRLLVLGLGGLGGVLAGSLAAAGTRLDVWTRRAEVRDLLRAQGLDLRDRRSSHRLRVPLSVVDHPAADAYDFALLAIPPDGLPALAREALPFLAPGGALVPLANGLPEERLASLVPPDHLVGAVINLNASSPAPGIAVRNSAGRITLGRAHGPPDATVHRLAAALAPVARVVVTDNLRGARWTKLALNAAQSSMVAASGEPLGAMLRHRFARHLALQLLGEVRAVARAEGVCLAGVPGAALLRLGLAPASRHGATALLLRHALLAAATFPSRHLRSSMLSQLERGLVPPVAFINGEVVTRGERHRIRTPANAALLAGVLSIAHGEARSSLATLRRIADAARSA